MILAAVCASAAGNAIRNSEKSEMSPDSVYVLESVSVTGSRVPMDLGTSARIVTVLDSVRIASMPAQTVNDILKFAAGVDVRQRGTMGVQTDISVRGGTFDQIAVLVNGINVSDPQTGHNAADFPVDMADIERIEILEGPASRIYGTSSLVGAINIVTKPGKGRGASLHAETGSYGYFNGGASLSFGKGRWNNRISGSWSRSDGYSRSDKRNLNADFDMLKAFFQGSYTGDDADVSYQAGISRKDFGSNTFYSAKYDEQFEHTLKSTMALSAQTKGAIHLKPSVYWNHSQDRFELFRGDDAKVPFNYHKTNVIGVELSSWVESCLGKTAFSAGMRNEDIVSTNLGNPLANPDGKYVVGLNRTQISFNLEHDIILRNFTLSAGVSAIKNTGNEDGFGFYPGIDASYRFAGNWKVYASYNSSYRMPTFTELFYSVGGYKADQLLKPEKMQSIEGGLKYSAGGVSAVATIYYHRGTDMIDWVKDNLEGEDAPWKSWNHSKINSLGEEFTLRLDLPAMVSDPDFFLRAINVSYSHINQDKELDGHMESMYALEYLKDKLVAQVDFHIWNRLFMNVSYRFQDRNGYDPYSLVDSRICWNAEGWSAYMEANNILDHTYYDFGYIPQPGIWFKAGVRFELGW